jgi:hydroxymethylglutaryl-CoA synthase
LWSLGHDQDGREELRAVCEKAGADPEAVLREITTSADLYERVIAHGVEAEPYPAASKLAKEVRRTDRFKSLLNDKMSLGSDAMMELGNIYTAALPAWLAAGLEEAQQQSVDLTGKTLIAIGYGSGDAAEAMPLRVVPGWEKAAAKIGFARALEGYVDLEQHQYEALHDGREVIGLDYQPSGELVIERVGREVGAEFQDVGIEYYAWVPKANEAKKRAAG